MRDIEIGGVVMITRIPLAPIPSSPVSQYLSAKLSRCVPYFEIEPLLPVLGRDGSLQL